MLRALALAVVLATVPCWIGTTAQAACTEQTTGGRVVVQCTDGGSRSGSQQPQPKAGHRQQPSHSGAQRMRPTYGQGPIRGPEVCADPATPDILRPMCHSVPYKSPDPPSSELREQRSISPEQAARAALASMEFPTPTINYGPSPERNEWGLHFIGVPYWYWTDNTAMPTTHTVTQNGITITFSVSAAHIVWDFGDGTVKACGPGTPWAPAVFEAKDSPTCGHRYQQPGTYTVTVTAAWTVHWAAMGASGTIPVTMTHSDHPHQYHEIHALLVDPEHN